MVILKFFADIFLPLVFLSCAFLFSSIPEVSGLISNTLPPFIPIGLFFIGFLLGWRFGQSNIAFAIIILLLSYLALRFAVFIPNKSLFSQILFPGIALLFPLNLLVFALLEERGIFSYWGMVRLTSILIQAAGLYWVCAYGGETVQAHFIDLFHHSLLSGQFDHWTTLPQSALVIFVVVGTWLVLQVIIGKRALISAYLGAVIAGFFALHFVEDPFSTDLFMTTALALFVVSIIQSAYTMAFVDELTAIPGRRALLMDMKKLRSPYVIAMADIDYFKKFNDTYGHDTGDQVLRMVAAQLAKIGGGGKTYRYGGEEFTILMPGAHNKSARKYLEEVRKKVEQSTFHIRGKGRPKVKPKKKTGKPKGKAVKVTISIGSAQSGGKKQKPDRVMNAADKALYRAKKAGRNQVSY